MAAGVVGGDRSRPHLTSIPQILIGVPGDSDDLYLRHQQVWQAVAKAAPRIQGDDFLYAQVKPRLFMVRSQRLANHSSSHARMPENGEAHRATIELVAMTGSKHDQPVPEALVSDWASRVLAAKGLAVDTLELLACVDRVGHKSNMRIGLRVASIAARVRVRDAGLLQKAFVSGVGRGKRFGFGMLRFDA
jgi:hypothetical protein